MDKSLMETQENNANYLAQDIAKVMYRNQFNALIETLERFHIPQRYYTLFDDRDESVCLVYDKGEWAVYFSERDLRTDEIRTGDPSEACRKMLYKISENNTEYQHMLSYFEKKEKNQPTEVVSSREIYRAVKDELKKLTSSVAAF